MEVRRRKKWFLGEETVCAKSKGERKNKREGGGD